MFKQTKSPKYIMSEKIDAWKFILIWVVFFSFGLSSVITAISHIIKAMH